MTAREPRGPAIRQPSPMRLTGSGQPDRCRADRGAPGAVAGVAPPAALRVSTAPTGTCSRRTRRAASAPGDRPHLVEDGAGPQVASVLGVFRGPAMAEEPALTERGVGMSAGFFDPAALPRDGVRIVRASTGRSVILPALRDVAHRGPDRATLSAART